MRVLLDTNIVLDVLKDKAQTAVQICPSTFYICSVEKHTLETALTLFGKRL